LPGEIQNVPPQPIAFGKYTLLERISHGGMAEVFRAKTQGTAGFERVVAIKLLLPQIANDADFVTMLIDEAKIAGQLSHANIAQIFDLGQVEGRYFIVQEYVPGRDLRAILHHLDDHHQRLGVAQSCHIILKICEALDYAHNKRDGAGQPLNLVHRDISPQNVIVSHEGEVKLIDFGIVKAEGRATRTLAGLVKGKFAYMSPEQIRGLPVDRRSDVFACGILLHELLTGQPLFKRGSEFETLQRARSAEIEPPSRQNGEVPPELDGIVLRALARHVDDRYQTAIALRDDLWEFVRASGQYHTRDQLSAWMLSTFGEPNAPELAPARSPEELGPGTGFDSAVQPQEEPGPRLPDTPLYGDDEVDNMTVVDADLQARLHLMEDADTVAAEPEHVAIPPPVQQSSVHGAIDAGPVPGLRELAEAAQVEPERAMFRNGDARRLAVGSEPSLDVGRGKRRGEAGEEEETTSDRSSAQQGAPAESAGPDWYEPETPERRRPAVASDDPDDRVAIVEHGQAGSAGVSETARTSPFMQMDPVVAGAVDLGGAQPGAPHAPMPVPTSGPEALTLAPQHEIPAPVPPGGFPPVYQLPAEPAFPPGPGGHGQNLMPGQNVMPGEFGPPPGPNGPYGPGMATGPYGQRMPPDAFQHGMWPPQPGQPLEDARAASARYLVAAAIGILVVAVTVSIVLAVTGS
jgi:serine/threonine protein kinase